MKLNSTLQTKNYLGLTDLDLEQCVMDPYYEYLRTPGSTLKFERNGSVITLEGLPLKIARDHIALVQPNPEIYSLGLVSSPVIYSGEVTPRMTVKGLKAGEYELDWLLDIRLLKI
jgi:hypothetical protein